MGDTNKGLHPFNEAGRKLKAAVIASLMRDKSVDRTLRELPKDAGEGWGELAEQLMRVMQGQVVEKLSLPAPGPIRIK